MSTNIAYQKDLLYLLRKFSDHHGVQHPLTQVCDLGNYVPYQLRVATVLYTCCYTTESIGLPVMIVMNQTTISSSDFHWSIISQGKNLTNNYVCK